MNFNLNNYVFRSGKHYGKAVIWVHFPYDLRIKNELKLHFKQAIWSVSQRSWYLPDTNEIREKIAWKSITPKIDFLSKNIHNINQPALIKLTEQLQLMRYSKNTIKTYRIEFAQLLYFLKEKHVDEITPDWLKAYFLYCNTKLNLSENLIHSRLNAIKFYFEKVLHRDKFFIDIPRPKKKSQLPKVFSQHDILKLFSCANNLKHLLMLKLCYGMGLRVSEIVNLKVQDIDSKRMQVLVQSGKGKKDRYIPLPQSILEELRTYYKKYRPKFFLFEGKDGKQYAIRSVQAVFKNAMRKGGINKAVGIHGLRHSYATHLLESGTDMYLIQQLLGHEEIKTTEIYAKVSNRQLTKIKSPLDDINM